MAPPLLNENGPQFAEARGINPPLVRAASHIGFALAMTGNTTVDTWPNAKEPVREEICEARAHLKANTDFEPSPFINKAAIDTLDALNEQFLDFINDVDDLDKNDTFTYLKILSDNTAYTSALLERHVTGNTADEGRNP